MKYVIIMAGDFMKKVDTILYDLDGTLINTNEIIIESFKEVFKVHFPNQIPDRDRILTFIGPTLQQTFSQYTSSDALIEEMIVTYRTFYKKYEVGNHELYEDVVSVLKELKVKGYNLGILTSKFVEAAWPSYTHYKLDEIFDSFTGLDDVKYPKPHKNAVETALSHFPNHKGAIMIGDNQGDILAGKNAGIYGVGVAWAIKGESHLREVNPDFILSNMNDIFRVLNVIEGDD